MTIRTESSQNTITAHLYQTPGSDKSADAFHQTLDGLRNSSDSPRSGTQQTVTPALYNLSGGTNVPESVIGDLKDGAHWPSQVISLFDKTTLKPLASSSAKLDAATSVATPERPLLRIPGNGNQGPPPPSQQAAITLAEIQQLAPETPHSAPSAKQVDTLLASLETNPADLNNALRGLNAPELVAILNQPGGANILTAGPRVPGSGVQPTYVTARTKEEMVDKLTQPQVNFSLQEVTSLDGQETTGVSPPADAVGAILASLSGHPDAIDTVVNRLNKNQLNAVLTSAARETTTFTPLGTTPEVFSYDPSRLVSIINAVSTGASVQSKTRVFSAVALGPLSNMLSNINSSGQGEPPYLSPRSQLAAVSHALSGLVESDPQRIVNQFASNNERQALTTYVSALLREGKAGQQQVALLMLQLKYGPHPNSTHPYTYIESSSQNAYDLGYFTGCVAKAVQNDLASTEAQQQQTDLILNGVISLANAAAAGSDAPGAQYVAALGTTAVNYYESILQQTPINQANTYITKLEDLATAAPGQTDEALTGPLTTYLSNGFNEALKGTTILG